MKFARTVSLALCAAAVAGMITGCSSQSQSATSSSAAKTPVSFKIAFSTWVGYGPMFIARDKGFFKKYGVDPQLTIVEDESTYASSLASNSVQAVAHVLDREVINYANGVKEKSVVALDQSLGGDGIIASSDIKTVADLKGKTVALDKSSTSYFFFLSVLKKNGIDDSSVTIKDMGASDAGASFVAGKIDAAVTWQPWLTNCTQRKGGHLLVSSKDYPNTIVDEVVFSDQFIKAHPDAVKGFVEGWYDGVDYFNTNKDDAISIMAKGLSIETSDFKSQVEGVKYYGKSENKSFFDKSTTDNIFSVTQNAVNFWIAKKMIKSSFNVDDLVSNQYYNVQ